MTRYHGRRLKKIEKEPVIAKAVTCSCASFLLLGFLSIVLFSLFSIVYWASK
jgi:hypothetical protein